MKKILIMMIIAFGTYSFAGEGHSHGHGHGHSHDDAEISKEKTGEIGRSQIERLVKSGKIDASWKKSTFDKSFKKKFKSRTEWVVTFDNNKGVKGKKLYIFLKLSGEFIAANFSGK